MSYLVVGALKDVFSYFLPTGQRQTNQKGNTSKVHAKSLVTALKR